MDDEFKWDPNYQQPSTSSYRDPSGVFDWNMNNGSDWGPNYQQSSTISHRDTSEGFDWDMNYGSEWGPNYQQFSTNSYRDSSEGFDWDMNYGSEWGPNYQKTNTYIDSSGYSSDNIHEQKTNIDKDLMNETMHLHLSPGKGANVGANSSRFEYLAELDPKYSNRFVIFFSLDEKIHLQMSKKMKEEVCVSAFPLEKVFHELIIDKQDHFYVVAIPGHTYIIRSNAEPGLLSRHSIELHPGRTIELDIDDKRIYYISVPSTITGIQTNANCAFLFICRNLTPIRSTELVTQNSW